MKKIIVAFDGLKFSEASMHCAIHTAKLTRSHLVGVFLDDITYSNYKIYNLVKTEGVLEKKLSELDEKDKDTRDKAAAKFGTACRNAGINHSIHRDRYIALQELLHESIYADLLIVAAKETLTHYAEELPTRFMRDLLTDVQCPVLLVPENFRPAKKLVILYNGEPSSVHAVKMISYLFPLPDYKTVEVVSVKPIKQSLHVPDGRLMKEFMKRHYPQATYKVLKGLPEAEILTYLKKQKAEVMVALGAYRRGRVSRWFRPSMADVLMQELDSPLFIAHSK